MHRLDNSGLDSKKGVSSYWAVKDFNDDRSYVKRLFQHLSEEANKAVLNLRPNSR